MLRMLLIFFESVLLLFHCLGFYLDATVIFFISIGIGIGLFDEDLMFFCLNGWWLIEMNDGWMLIDVEDSYCVE